MEQFELDCEPRPPHVPEALRQLPLSHTPLVLLVPQLVPAATHLPLTQQPSPAHVLSAQHASPGPPHVWHFPPEHPRPEPVQKFELEPLDGPWQQLCPSPPHVPHPPGALAAQLPASVPPHAPPGATHLPPAQHAPAPHVLLPQQA
jgi:hypothetical protein